MAKQPTSSLDKCIESVKRIQEFDTQKLIQESRLGEVLRFTEVVQPANRLVGLYRQLSVAVLPDLPLNRVESILSRADSDYNRFESILSFDVSAGSATQSREQLINQVSQAYDGLFGELHPFISYSASKAVDFQRLELEQRALLQRIKDESASIVEQLEQQRADATAILEEVRKTAAEQGVSQQAIFFREEVKEHSDQADWWFWATIVCSILVFLWALFGPFLLVKFGYADVQLGVSKVLTFGVLSFLTYLSAKNFLSHKHNAIVNKHRQNALSTYRALVDAAMSQNTADVVLTHASACIFSPQSTGYASGKSVDGATAKSVVEMIGRPLAGGE